DASRVLVLDVDVSRAHIDPADRLPFYLRLTQAIAAVPGVAQASGSMMTPVSGAFGFRLLDLPGAPSMPDRERLVAFNFTSPGWFATYGTPLRFGPRLHRPRRQERACRRARQRRLRSQVPCR